MGYRAGLLVLGSVCAVGSGDGPGEGRRAEPAPGPVVLVQGEVEHPLRLTADELVAMPRRTVVAKDHDGREARFEGVAVGEVLKRAGAKLGERLRGPAHAAYLLVEAGDGYRVVFALPELDEAYTDRLVLLADRREGRPLEAPEGPFRLVVPGEKKHARWVRMVGTLTVRRVDADLVPGAIPPRPRTSR
jgi:DMSO/TMAO reductase YedYZ molybdopterin-dependent catalytic subunit